MNGGEMSYKITGGAQIGRVHSTWPFGSLKVSSGRLEVSTSIKKVVFAPEDIINIELNSKFSIIGRGIRITHRVDKYHEKVLFFSLSSPDVIIGKIKEAGFLGGQNGALSEKDEVIIAAQLNGGPAMKWPAKAVGLVAWNVPILWGVWPAISMGEEMGARFYQGALVSIGLLFACSLGMAVVEPFRKLVFQAGYDEAGIRKIGWFLTLGSGFLFIILFLVSRSI